MQSADKQNDSYVDNFEQKLMFVHDPVTDAQLARVLRLARLHAARGTRHDTEL